MLFRSSTSISAARIFDKTASANTGWDFGVGGNGLDVQVSCAVSNGINNSGLANLPLNMWHHVALCWDDAADRKPFLFVDGVQFGTPVAGNGAIIVDAANDLFLGNRSANDRGFNGRIGWTRISNIVRYSAPFTPPARCIIPDKDTNTVWLGLVEGTGTVIYDRSGMAVVTNGTLTIGAGSWEADCCP